MNVLFSHAYFLEEDPREKNIMKPYPPLGILSVAAWLEKHEVPCEVLDATFSNTVRWQAAVKKADPDLLALYANLVTKVQLLKLVKWVKQTCPGTTIVLGGPDVTYNLDEYLKAEVNFCIIGEGEQTMLELTRALQSGSNDFAAIPGLAYKLPDGSVFKTMDRIKLKNLDVLPLPARHKIELQKYLSTWQEHHGHRSISISTQRGCPYTCRWCSTAVYGQSYRRRSPAHVLMEILHLQKHYGSHRIWFVDDVFTVSHKWLEAFADLLRREQVSINFECITRADRLNDQVLKTLKRMGCFRVWIGAESGSQKVLDLMDRRVNVEQVKNMIVSARMLGLEAGTFIMLGYPGELEADIKLTLRHLKHAEPDHFTITLAYPIKGTELYAQVEEHIDKPSAWHEHTDRDLNYDRKYSTKYYQHAIRWVTNAVYLKKHRRNKRQLQMIMCAAKVMISRTAMYWHRWSSN